jgi:hypothetical protein
VQGRLQAEVLATGEQRVEGGLLERRPDRPPDLRAVVDDVEAADPRRPRRRRQQRGQHVDGRGLPGAVRAEEAVDLTPADRQVDSGDGGHVLEATDEPFDLDSRSARHPPRLPAASEAPAEPYASTM